MNVRAMLDAGFANAELASALDTEGERVYSGYLTCQMLQEQRLRRLLLAA